MCATTTANPSVSIIMSAYNHEDYVGKAIESILSQDYENWTLLVIDDCSTDKTPDVIASYSDERIVFYPSDHNIGAVRNFNKLLNLADGDYIAFIGSDDMWEANKLSSQVAYMEINPHIAACFSAVTIIDENDNPASSNTDVYGFFDFEDDSREYCLKRFFYSGNFLCHSTVLVRKSIVDEVGNFDIRLRQLHDFDYWTRILVNHPIHIMREKLCLYRRVFESNKSMSALTKDNNVRTYNEQRFVISKMIDLMDEDTFSETLLLGTKVDVSKRENLICEKFVLLKSWVFCGFDDKLASLWFISNYISDASVLNTLSSQYDYSLNDYYADVAVPQQGCQLCYYDEYEQMRRERDEFSTLLYATRAELSNERQCCEAAKDELERVYRSTSWRVSMPIRSLGRLFKK